MKAEACHPLIVIVIDTYLLLRRHPEQYAHLGYRRRHFKVQSKLRGKPPPSRASSSRTKYSHCQLPFWSLPLPPLTASSKHPKHHRSSSAEIEAAAAAAACQPQNPSSSSQENPKSHQPSKE